ncbi:hypothetical protein BSKO_11158 [Bryopsis sp. KO-2023]|nr:hypothetical protein BSKO_11158 [Bryopsis sp. KO-2023]
MNGSPTKSKGRTPRPEMKSIRPRKVVTKAKRAAKTVSGVHGRDKKATKASGETSLHSEPSAVPSAAKETADENTLRVCSNVQDARPLDTHSADENADERARSSIESLQEIEFRALLEEASARVIQMYWRRHRSHKKMESETLSDKRRASTKGTLQSSQEPNLVSNQTASGEDLAAEKSEHIAIAEGKALKVLETVRASVGPFPDEVSTRDRYEDVENVEPTSSDGDCGSARDPRPRSCGFLFESDFMCRERNGESIPSESCRNEKRSLRVEASLCTHSQKQCWRDGGTHDLSTGEPTAIERRVPVDENTPCIGVQKRSGKSRDQFRASEKVESIMNLLKRAERQEIPSDACSYRAAFVSDTSGSSSSNHADDTVSTSGSVGGFSAKSSGVKSTQLAESIYDGFKSKVQSLRKELEGRDARIVRLTQDLENAQAQHRNRLEELKQSQAKSLEQQKVMQEADLRQRLEFIDALLVDKDKLSLECEKLSAEVKEQQNQHEKEVEALKHRWSDELKRQRETWQASEKSKRDQWQAQKKKEIAEMTAKAMEPKFVQMAENYTSEVNRLKDKISTQERLLEEHERHSMQLRDRLMKEREDAVEKERVTAHARLMQEKEKHKMEIESVMDKAGTDVEREKRSAATRIEELQKRHQEELTNEIRRWEEEARKGKIEVEREKAAVEQNHSKALSRVREECGAEREGWKEAIRERAERQMRSELEKRKKLLEQERDEEIQA